MRCRQKPVELEYYQFGVGDATPDWFMDALSNHTIMTFDVHTRSPFYNGHKPEASAIVKVNGNTIPSVVNYKDFILHNEDGTFRVCPENLFDVLYERV